MIPASVLGVDAALDLGEPWPPMAPTALPALPGAREVEVLGMRLRSLDTGGSGLPVALVHGLSTSTLWWAPTLAALRARGRRVLALDLPGFGASEAPDAPCTPPWYARVVAAWLDALGVPRAAVVGHSMGGQVALRLALDHPERVLSLALAAPAGIEGFSREAGDWMKGYWTEDRAARATEAEVVANFTRLAFNRVDAFVVERLRERLALMRHPAYAATSRAVSRCVAGMIDHPLREELGRLSPPTLVVFGDEDRMIPNPVFTRGRTADVAAEARRLIPHARLVLLRGAGHMVHLDDPEGFQRALDEHLP